MKLESIKYGLYVLVSKDNCVSNKSTINVMQYLFGMSSNDLGYVR